MTPLRFFRFLAVLAVLCLGAGCDSAALQIQAQTANAVAGAANAGLPVLVERYKAEGDAAIEKAATRAEAETGVAAVKDRWSPIWSAWEALRVAEDGWAVAIEQGGDLGAAIHGLSVAYCGLVAVWPADIPAIPLSPLRCDP